MGAFGWHKFRSLTPLFHKHCFLKDSVLFCLRGSDGCGNTKHFLNHRLILSPRSVPLSGACICTRVHGLLLPCYYMTSLSGVRNINPFNFHGHRDAAGLCKAPCSPVVNQRRGLNRPEDRKIPFIVGKYLPHTQIVLFNISSSSHVKELNLFYELQFTSFSKCVWKQIHSHYVSAALAEKQGNEWSPSLFLNQNIYM